MAGEVIVQVMDGGDDGDKSTVGESSTVAIENQLDLLDTLFAQAATEVGASKGFDKDATSSPVSKSNSAFNLTTSSVSKSSSAFNLKSVDMAEINSLLGEPVLAVSEPENILDQTTSDNILDVFGFSETTKTPAKKKGGISSDAPCHAPMPVLTATEESLPSVPGAKEPEDSSAPSAGEKYLTSKSTDGGSSWATAEEHHSTGSITQITVPESSSVLNKVAKELDSIAESPRSQKEDKQAVTLEASTEAQPEDPPKEESKEISCAEANKEEPNASPVQPEDQEQVGQDAKEQEEKGSSQDNNLSGQNEQQKVPNDVPVEDNKEKDAGQAALEKEGKDGCEQAESNNDIENSKACPYKEEAKVVSVECEGKEIDGHDPEAKARDPEEDNPWNQHVNVEAAEDSKEMDESTGNDTEAVCKSKSEKEVPAPTKEEGTANDGYDSPAKAAEDSKEMDTSTGNDKEAVCKSKSEKEVPTPTKEEGTVNDGYDSPASVAARCLEDVKNADESSETMEGSDTGKQVEIREPEKSASIEIVLSSRDNEFAGGNKKTKSPKLEFEDRDIVTVASDSMLIRPGNLVADLKQKINKVKADYKRAEEKNELFSKCPQELQRKLEEYQSEVGQARAALAGSKALVAELRDELDVRQAAHKSEVEARRRCQKALQQISDYVQKNSDDSALVDQVLSLLDRLDSESMAVPTLTTTQGTNSLAESCTSCTQDTPTMGNKRQESPKEQRGFFSYFGACSWSACSE